MVSFTLKFLSDALPRQMGNFVPAFISDTTYSWMANWIVYSDQYRGLQNTFWNCAVRHNFICRPSQAMYMSETFQRSQDAFREYGNYDFSKTDIHFCLNQLKVKQAH